MAEVRGVVGRDAADVEPRPPGRRRPGARNGSACRTAASGSPWPGTAGTKGAGHDFTGQDYGADGHSAGHGIAGQPGLRHRVPARAQQRLGARAAGRAPRRGSAASRARRRARRRGRRAGSRARARSVSGSGSPAQPQSTVRSFGSTPRLTPWSQPRTIVAVAQQVAALAVGVVEHGVEHRHRAQRRLAGCARRRPVRPPGDSPSSTTTQPSGTACAGVTSTSGSGSPSTGPTHSCTDPGPSGPLRSTVGRHDVEAAGRAHEVGGPLAGDEGAVGVVPQRPLAAPPACG